MQVQVDVAQQIEAADPSKVDVVFHITEGQQIFVRKVLLTGLHYTRPSHGGTRPSRSMPGDPLNQTRPAGYAAQSLRLCSLQRGRYGG